MPSPATAFGTIEGGGQHREHERITRAALACPAGAGSFGDCFEPKSSDQLAGRRTSFGAVGAPDRTEVSDPAAHCDDADHLDGGYPRTRAQATGRLLDCVEHLRGRFHEAVDAAAGLFDGQNRLVGAEVDLSTECVLDASSEHRAKCETVEAFGRALHRAQDFYSHRNWTDVADSSRPVGADNPPGLGLSAPSAILDPGGTGTPAVPPPCPPAASSCRTRFPVSRLAKDASPTPASTRTTGPSIPAPAVSPRRPHRGAGWPTTSPGPSREPSWRPGISGRSSERHWRPVYGRSKASVMICALTHDDPVNDCQRHRTVTAVLVIFTGLIGLIGAGFLMIRIRRRRGRLLRRADRRRDRRL